MNIELTHDLELEALPPLSVYGVEVTRVAADEVEIACEPDHAHCTVHTQLINTTEPEQTAKQWWETNGKIMETL